MSVSAAHLISLSFITVFFLCGFFILFIKGVKHPAVYMATARLLTAVVFLLNFIQNYHQPYFGSILLNPIHLLVPLFSVPLQFAYIFGLMRPQGYRPSFWIGVALPTVALGLLYFAVVGIRGFLPVISNYGQILAYRNEPELWIRFLALGLLVWMLVLLSLKGFGMQRKHLSNLPYDFSYTEGISLQWIRWLIFMILIRNVFVVLSLTTEGRLIKLLSTLFFSFEAMIITVWVLRQKDIYRRPYRQEPVPEAGEEEIPPQNVRKTWKTGLIELLEKEEVFKDPDLDRETVCGMLGINRTYLSQIINHELNTTFYSLVNEYRLKKSVEIMKNPHYLHAPIKNISSLCGFKNPNTFSKLFKQTYGKTPTEWRFG